MQQILTNTKLTDTTKLMQQAKTEIRATLQQQLDSSLATLSLIEEPVVPDNGAKFDRSRIRSNKCS